MKKKGISPLIATVLILGFTVALAAIIMTWGTSFTKKMQEQTEETADIQVKCATDVAFDIKSVCNTSKTDYKVLIENNGNQDIKKWIVRLYASDTDVESYSCDTAADCEIGKFGLKQVKAVTTKSGIKKVEAIPIILSGNKDITCSQNVDSYGDVEGDYLAKNC